MVLMKRCELNSSKRESDKFSDLIKIKDDFISLNLVTTTSRQSHNVSLFTYKTTKLSGYFRKEASTSTSRQAVGTAVDVKRIIKESGATMDENT